MNDYQSLFDKLQKNESSRYENNNVSFGNDYLLKLKTGNSYTFRLLWLPSDVKREYPMINQYVHRFWDANALSNKEDKVICPTSQYIMGETRAAFNKCPICSQMSKIYKDAENGSSSAKDLYNLFRRNCIGYVPVYVVAGPDDCVGQIRILQFSKQIRSFFDAKIFGIVSKSKYENENTNINNDDIIGLEAFMYLQDNTVVTTGYNFTISVGVKKVPSNGKTIDLPTYTMDFSRRASTISDFNGTAITPEYFNSINNTIKYDADYYKITSDADLQRFVLNHLSDVASNNIVETSSSEIVSDITEENLGMTDTVNVNTVAIQSDSQPDDDIDVDSLINGLV